MVFDEDSFSFDMFVDAGGYLIEEFDVNECMNEAPYNYAVATGMSAGIAFDVRYAKKGFTNFFILEVNSKSMMEHKKGGTVSFIALPSDDKNITYNSGATRVTKNDRSYIKIAPDAKIRFASSFVNSILIYHELFDEKAPAVTGFAPLPESNFKKGDEVRVAITFDEIVTDTSGQAIYLYLNEYLPVKNPTVNSIEGFGTNVLYCTCEVTEDFNGADMNEQLYEVVPDFGRWAGFTDFAGNSSL